MSYKCQIPGCTNKVQIRQKIKQGEYKGYLVCGYHKKKYDSKPIQYRTKKVADKRKKERSCLESFFKKAIEELEQNPYCKNCNTFIKTDYHPQNNIAHILSKRKYKSVMCDDNNRVFLCDYKDTNGLYSCHKNFDDKVLERKNMPVFQTAKKFFQKLKNKVVERGVERDIFEK